MTEEINMWKIYPGICKEFEVSNSGEVRRIGGKLISQFMDKRHDKAHYMKVSLWSKAEKKEYTRWVHRMVMEAFIGERPKDCVINHINHNKSDNRLKNLEYVTCSDNLRKSLRDGTDRQKLSSKAIKRMRKLFKAGVTPKELSLIYAIHRDHASAICNSRAWKWLD